MPFLQFGGHNSYSPLSLMKNNFGTHGFEILTQALYRYYIVSMATYDISLTRLVLGGATKSFNWAHSIFVNLNNKKGELMLEYDLI